MSLSRIPDLFTTSTDCAALFLLSPSILRPMTSHARIEGGALYKKSERVAVDLPPSRKNFLPQLVPTLSSSDGGSASNPRDIDSIHENVEEDTESDTYRQRMWAGQANILVTVRLRPHLSHDRDREEIVKPLGHKEVVVLARGPDKLMQSMASANSPYTRRHPTHPHRKPRHASASPSTSMGPGGARGREKRYAFDYVFTPRDGQQKVYQHTTKFLIHGVLNGYNATVFAYGCTGAGKTYTMFGTPEEPGIMARTLEDLFRNIERVHADAKAGVKYRVSVSFLEVYNENIRDLLSDGASCSSAASTPASEFLDLREDPIRGPVVAGISEVEACNAQEVMKLLRKGNRHRSQEATAANAVSSRSHAVLQVLVEQTKVMNSGVSASSSGFTGDLNVETLGTEESTELKFGKLSLVDLAGSERAAVTQNRGQRLLEGANINRSLLALGNCINALGEKRGAGSAGVFVPYRDSKLTRLLKDSLGGNCRTVMIANVSLAASSVEETLNTLKYANRAKNIKTTVRRNVVELEPSGPNQSSIVSDLREEIAALKKELQRQQQQPHIGGRLLETEQRWVESKKEERETSNNSREEEDWKHGKLQEARQYIAQSFREHCQLKNALLKVEHQIQSYKADSRTESTRMELPVSLESQEGDTDASPSVPTAESASVPVETPLIQALTIEREGLEQQLASNERAMAEFRRGIEQSPLMECNELVREVLRMEYRIGDLEIDKVQLQTLRDLQVQSVGNNDELPPSPASQPDHDEKLVPPTELQPQNTEREVIGTHLPELQSHRTSVNDPEGLVETRLEPEEANRLGDKPQQQALTAASPVVLRKNWGLHMTNTSLPYIRLRKTDPVPLFVEPTSSLAIAIGGLNASATGKSTPTSSLPAPYLKALKQRRKAAGKSASNTKKKQLK